MSDDYNYTDEELDTTHFCPPPESLHHGQPDHHDGCRACFYGHPDNRPPEPPEPIPTDLKERLDEANLELRHAIESELAFGRTVESEQRRRQALADSGLILVEIMKRRKVSC